VIQVNPDEPILEWLPNGLTDDNPELRVCIAQHLRDYRLKMDLPQAKVARETGFSRAHLSNVEAGRARTGWKRLQTMADYYDLGLQQLIEDCSAMLGIAQPQEESLQMSNDKEEKTVANSEAETEKRSHQQCSAEEERFVLVCYCILDAEEQQQIRQKLVDAVTKHNEKLVGNHKKV
jgi:transcriptional regulator with XRE-family HTH domain